MNHITIWVAKAVSLDDMSNNNNDKHKVLHSFEHNITNTFQNSYILPTCFTSLLAIIGNIVAILYEANVQ